MISEVLSDATKEIAWCLDNMPTIYESQAVRDDLKQLQFTMEKVRRKVLAVEPRVRKGWRGLKFGKEAR